MTAENLETRVEDDKKAKKFKDNIDNALFSGNAERYYLAHMTAFEHGINFPVEDRELYAKGQLEAKDEETEENLEAGAEKLTMPKQKKQRKQIIPNWAYEQFLNEAKNYPSNLSNSTDAKMVLLRKYFPRFREGNSQDLSRYGSVQVGRIFLEVRNYAKKRIDKKGKMNNRIIS